MPPGRSLPPLMIPRNERDHPKEARSNGVMAGDGYSRPMKAFCTPDAGGFAAFVPDGVGAVVSPRYAVVHFTYAGSVRKRWAPVPIAAYPARATAAPTPTDTAATATRRRSAPAGAARQPAMTAGVNRTLVWW